MKKLNRTISSLLAILLTLPVLSAGSLETRRKVTPGGMPFGLTMYTSGVVVVSVEDNGAADTAGVRENDVITRLNGEEIRSNEQLRELISASDGADIELSVLRGKSPISLSLTPEEADDGSYAAGMWVRDSTAGLGTVTYFDSASMSFGALGHGICDRDTGMLLPLKSGEIVQAEITSVTRAQKGVAGGLNGYMTDEKLGELSVNSGYGVYGRYTAAPEGEEVECAFDSDIHTGGAEIYTTVDDGGVKAYRVIIESLNLSDTSGQNLVLRVIDPDLMEKTGGIVQGMSGSPIIQDGRLVGAVTHVFVNSPEMGYGISIGNMLACYEEFGGI